MNPRDLRIAFDSNILSYFLQAASGIYDPATDADDNLRPERVAAFRLFLYGPELWIVPTVAEEAERIRYERVREEHQRWIWYHLKELLPSNVCDKDVLIRRARYEALHSSGAMDCMAVAEAESRELHRFLTMDRKLLANMSGQTERIVVQRPTECWADLDLHVGATPRLEPRPPNPLANVDWWRW